MILHTVRSGETLSAIAARYGVSARLLGLCNNMIDKALVPGQVLVVLYPLRTHTVRPGETLISIARSYGVSVNRLWRNNIWLYGRASLAVGQTIVIAWEQERQGRLRAGGYAYPFIDKLLLRQELPYLDIMMPFSYGITENGGLVPLDDSALLALSREYGVDPYMHLSTLTEEGTFSSERASAVLRDPGAQARLIAAVSVKLAEKNYAGCDVDFEFIPGEDAPRYASFLAALRAKIAPRPLIAALAPKTFATQPGLLYEGHDYGAVAAAVDRVLLMTYEWGYTYGPPMAVAPLPNITKVLNYAKTEMPPDKIYLGIPNYGYDWPLPFEKGVTKADSIGCEEAVNIARRYGAEIQYDETAQAPFFRYTSEDGKAHEVWFEDARSIRAKLELAAGSGCYGVLYWNLMRSFPQNWLVLDSLYGI